MTGRISTRYLDKLPVVQSLDGGNYRRGVMLRHKFGSAKNYVAPVLLLCCSEPYSNTTWWLRLDKADLPTPNDGQRVGCPADAQDEGGPTDSPAADLTKGQSRSCGPGKGQSRMVDLRAHVSSWTAKLTPITSSGRPSQMSILTQACIREDFDPGRKMPNARPSLAVHHISASHCWGTSLAPLTALLRHASLPAITMYATTIPSIRTTCSAPAVRGHASIIGAAESEHASMPWPSWRSMSSQPSGMTSNTPF